MATFQLSNNNKNGKKDKNKNIKAVVGWILLGVSTFVFLFSITKLIPFLNSFLLGLLGLFVYPAAIVGLLVALALLNNKRYVMPKKYVIFLGLSLYLVLSIVQLIIIGSPAGKTYFEYIGLNYTKKMTAGGMLIGFIPSTLNYLMGAVATYIMLSVLLAICIAFFVQEVISLRQTMKYQEPIRIHVKEKEETKKPFVNDNDDEKNKKVFGKVDPEIKIMLDGNQKEEQEREMSIRERLGLVEGYKQPVQPSKEIQLPKDDSNEVLPNGMTMKEYLLSPPTIDFEKFKKQNERLRDINLAHSRKMTQQDEEEIEQLKNEDIEDNYDSTYENESHVNLTEVAPDDITNEAEDIIKSVFEQERIEREENSYKEGEVNIVDDNYDNFENENTTDDYKNDEEVYHDEPESASGVKKFIDFGDLEDNEPEIAEEPKEEPKVENNDRNLFRDRRDNFDDRENQLQNRSFDRNRESEFLRNKPIDEMQKRRDFVDIKPEKQEKIKPYRYKKPPIDLITTTSDDLSIFNDEVPAKRVALENALEKFGVPAKVVNVVIGPTVTRYELQMPDGISVKKVLTLDADIAYALSATGIRIEAPVPGRSVVGIEVPNSKIAKVSIKDILTSKDFTMNTSPLTFALGKDISNNVRTCNLQKMPHLLVAGATRSGKSVCLNSIIVSLLYRSSPEDVKFIMIDPKQVELSIYEGLPHLIVPKVIKEPEKAVNALTWAVDEMERRYNLMNEAGVRNIEEYNKIEKVVNRDVKKMPYIVIIFDEFADFIQVAKNEIEDKIRRITQKARAAGLHLILATQRPSADVVTGTIKANLPARIAFRVNGRINSEVILDSTGAEKLLGNGDMLYKPDGSEMSRIQGCFIDTPETKDVVNYIRENNDEIIDEDALNAINNPGKATGGGNGDSGKETDALLPQALKICIDNGMASITMIQRKLGIGWPRAAKIIDQMEERGYVSTADGAKQRSVYISIEEFYSIFGDIYD